MGELPISSPEIPVNVNCFAIWEGSGFLQDEEREPKPTVERGNELFEEQKKRKTMRVDGIEKATSLSSVKTGKSVLEHHCERDSGLSIGQERIAGKPLSGDENDESKWETERKKPKLLLGGLSPHALPEANDTVDDYR